MASSSGVIRGADGKDRCYWCDAAADYRAYHDGEWDQPVADESGAKLSTEKPGGTIGPTRNIDVSRRI